ncbi:MAG: PQQ-binding-like beta-propeller repeat protein [Rhodocyclaceae bacterium]|nr:PQQ-binding-like beta-propeller repeat protein [Rhodocyclaceae bacterium]
MTDGNRWPSSPAGEGGAYWAGERGGIPRSTRPDWVDPLAGFWHVASDGDLVIVKGDGRETFAWSLATGELAWRTGKLPGNSTGFVVLADDQVLAGDVVLDRATGESLRDLKTLFGPEPLYRYPRNLAAEGGFLRDIRHAGDTIEAGWVGFDGRIRTMPIPARPALVDASGRLVIGTGRGSDIHGFEVETGKTVWRHELPWPDPAKKVIGGLCRVANRLYVLYMGASVRCLDVSSGEELWDWQESDVPDAWHPDYCGENVRCDFLAACGDRVYVGRNRHASQAGQIRVHEAGSGEVESVWELETGIVRGCLAGDLLFTLEPDKMYRDERPVARDRYTGDIVWRAAQTFDHAVAIVSAGDRVLYSGSDSVIQCFAWNAPYRSPARPAGQGHTTV